MKYCKFCKELIFSVEVLRFSTDDRPLTTTRQPICCPFCGRDLLPMPIKTSGEPLK